ncbi:MAG: triose-phosphate isomerase [Clostridia bacterium]|nr:triose-phosphate isomerase [Clostridia bacterium]
MKKLIIGNFKMNTTPSEFKSYAMTFVTKAKSSKNDIVLCVPYTHLSVAKELFVNSNVDFGAQNICEEEKGAFTGEISASMIKDLGATYTIIGHSERRTKFKESDKLVNKKIKTALANGLKVILCVGENLQTRTNKQAYQFVKKQLDDDLKGIYENELESVIISYEPIWAIGTGKNATNADIKKMAETIRKEVAYLYSEKASEKATILYGGSVNINNYKKILQLENVNGALIGGACLDVDNFAVIAREKY